MKTQFLVKSIVMFIMALTLPAMAETTTTIMGPEVNFRAQNIKVDPNNGVGDFPLTAITIKSEGGPTTVTGFYVSTQNLSAVPTTLRIYSNHAGLIGTSSSSATTVTINTDTVIENNTSANFTLTGDFSSNASGWCIGRIIGIRVENQNETSKDVFAPSEIYGPERRFFGGVANWVMITAPTISASTDQNGFTTSMTATFTLQVTADGINLAQPTGKDFVVIASCNPNNQVICNTVSAITIPNSPVADGTTHEVTVTASISSADVHENGLYQFSIKQINWGSNPSSQIQQYWGIEDFRTWFASYYRPETPPAKPIVTPSISADLYQVISGLSQANDFGQAGQLVGEGGFIRITPHDISPNRTVVFPYPGSEHKGQVMRISAAMSAIEMIPIVSAPTDLLGLPYGSFSQYPISNVANTTSNGMTVKTTFDVNIGSFVCHGKFVRTGDGSCTATFYWGLGSTHDSSGSKVDMINLSPSLPDIEHDIPTGLPPRFQFKCTNIRRTVTGFLLDIVSLPRSFKVERSIDLINWSGVDEWDHGYQYYPIDSVGSSNGWVNVQTLDPTRCFFRIVTLEE
ncbi:MAG: hypothetical protein KBB54_03345 [Candidatus Pacebacteria bacterium]|nr:hypothetical protein [Candidatus Paceibacterota bacterium]MBP9819070.1 hypothetical protein [Candidatus Paceibacterota bacterium]